MGVGLNSSEEGLWLTDTYTGHAQGYREYQPELAVRCLLYAADGVILHWGWGGV